MWIARDKDGTLCLFSDKPVKGHGQWMPPSDDSFWTALRDGMEGFSDVKWSGKPVEVALVRKEAHDVVDGRE